MADHSTIEWTDATWNVITGCEVISPGCKNCYAMKLAGTRLRNHWSRSGLTQESAAGPVWNGQVRYNEAWLMQPLQWSRPRMIFVAAHGDLFHEAVNFHIIDQVFAVMALSPQHTYQVLTKRPARMREYLDSGIGIHVRSSMIGQQAARLQLARGGGPVVEWTGMPMPHVLLGASVEDQVRADLRRGPMREIAASGWTTWASYEPALGPVDWAEWNFLRWMVSGGESGQNPRPHHPDWHRATRDWCRVHGVPYLFKQWGAWRPVADGVTVVDDRQNVMPQQAFPDGQRVVHLGKKAAGRELDGVVHDGFPMLGGNDAE